MISAFGHFVSFLLSLTNNLLMIPTGYTSKRNLHALFAFYVPSFNFFLYPFIETICSENLRNTLFNVS